MYYFEVLINKQIVLLNAIQLIDRKKIIIQNSRSNCKSYLPYDKLQTYAVNSCSSFPPVGFAAAVLVCAFTSTLAGLAESVEKTVFAHFGFIQLSPAVADSCVGFAKVDVGGTTNAVIGHANNNAKIGLFVNCMMLIVTNEIS